jgi:hypothetical protein
MRLLSLVLVTAMALASLQATPLRAEANSGTWDIAEYDSCMPRSADDLDRILGPSWNVEDLIEHYRYCCYKSGGVWTGRQCQAPASSASASSVRLPHLGKLDERVNPGRLESVCQDVKGAFDDGQSGGAYLCTKKNCDLEGGDCAIACADDLRCLAFTPNPITAPLTLFGILQNGDNRNRGSTEPSSKGRSSEEPPPGIF